MVAPQCWAWEAKRKWRLGLEMLTQYGEGPYGLWLVIYVSLGLPGGRSRVSAEKNCLLQAVGKGGL